MNRGCGITAKQEELLLQLASMLLLQRKEISCTEIRALPLIEPDCEVDWIIDYLLRRFNAEKIQRKVESTPIMAWDTIIRLVPS